MTNKISQLGLGLAALGRPGYINLGHAEDLNEDYDEFRMESQTHKMLDKAYGLGIRYFDAAQSYGKAEQFLASWLKKTNPKEVLVGSKWGYYYNADWSVDAEKHEIKEHTIKRLNLQWPESKSRLDPYLKLYQIHSATFESGVLENRAVLDRMGEIKSEGYAIGLSVSGPNQSEVIKAALKVIVDGDQLFDSVQATYNMLDQSPEEALKMATDAGLKTIIKEAVANGRLTERNSSADYISVIQKIAHLHGVSVDAIAIAFVIQKPFVNRVLSGAAVEAHLISNLQATQIQLTQVEIDTLSKLKMSPDQYWKDRSRLSWN
ncbi:MAG: aryl-alcohol dehydrogenase-like predicted oxidoreductase [Cyclobacteriaceae bacterium]|jgi:aryl-alcohol dehydrogenase-like predicted oxidoreductase